MPYDPIKWQAGDWTIRRRRRGWLRWYLLFAVLMTLPIPLIYSFASGKGEGDIASAAIVLPLVIGMGFSPFARASWLTARGQATFDEFELAALHRATTAAYGTFLGIVAIGLVVLWIASIAGGPAPESPLAWSAWAFALIGAGIAMPVLFAEFMVPLPPASDPDEEDDR